MEIEYKYYEPNQGLETLQAKLYNETSGHSITGKELEESYKSRDPRMIRYALTLEGKLLSFVTARESKSQLGRVYINYPCSISECPIEVQEKIFTELIIYLTKKEGILVIASIVLTNLKTANMETKFYRRNNFIELERIYRYCQDFNLEEIIQWNMDEEMNSFKTRLATIDDLDLLVEIAKKDLYLKNFFKTNKEWTNFYERILEEGFTMIVYQGDQIVAAGSVRRFVPDGFYLTGDKERILFRISANQPEYSQSLKILLRAFAEESLSRGWNEIPLRIQYVFTARNQIAIPLAEIRSEFELFEIIYEYQPIMGINSLSGEKLL